MMKRRTSLVVLVATLAVISLTLLTTPAAAATFIVTRFDDPPPGNCDPNDCSLREAVIAANTAAGADIIQLSAGTYTLSIPGTAEDAAANGDLDVTDPLTIQGTGRDATIINAGGAATNEAHFEVMASLTMSMLTITGGANTPGLDYDSVSGIGLRGTGTLTLTDVAITGNTTAATGCCSGITGESGSTMTLTNVDITNNTSGSNCCAGIVATSDITLTNVRINGNRSENCCVGVTANGTLNFTNVEIVDNFSADGCCAGIVASLDDPSTLTNVTVARNTAGGADFDCCAGVTTSGTLTLKNATVADNSTVDCCAGVWSSGTNSLNNVTVVRNVANSDNNNVGGDDDGSGVVHTGGTFTIQNTLVHSNTVGTGAMGPDCFGTITSGGYNIIGTTADCTFTPSTGDQLGVNPLLGALADNGGFVPTVPIQKGSPAVNGGNPAVPGSGGSACEAADARGLARNCDIGAYELTFCRKVAVNRIGTTGNDSLRGTAGRDGMLGFGGKDALRGKGGKDGLCGGPGKDLLKGGAGKDILDGGPGKDLCVGGPGRDKARSCEKRKSIP
ncbi:MAG: choice-of-anchor Q domain-containing protein [Actinomycetota bacterium]